MTEMVNGQRRAVEVVDFLAYYKSEINKYGPPTAQPSIFPQDLSDNWLNLEMVAPVGQNDPQWSCRRNGSGSVSVLSQAAMPRDCTGDLTVQFWFPHCLNTSAQPTSDRTDGSGRNQNHTPTGQASWLTYAQKRSSTADGCPSGWERIPALSFSVCLLYTSPSPRDS